MSNEALVIVDVQNDFCPGGSLAVPNGDEVVLPINRVVRYAKEHAWVIVATRDWHPAQTTHFNIWPPHCVKDSKGAEFHPELSMEGIEVFSKGMGEHEDAYSGFESVNSDGLRLDEFLKINGVTRVFTAGLALDYCVKATATDAATRAYETFLLLDATRAVSSNFKDIEKTLSEMREKGVKIVNTEDIIRQES